MTATLSALSPAERRVLDALVSGTPLGALAHDLYLQPQTVKNHLSAIYHAFGLGGKKGCARAAAVGQALGVTPDDPRWQAGLERAGLTPRQRQVAGLILAGEGNRAIAAALGIAPTTAVNHSRDLLRRAGATDRAHLVLVLAGQAEPVDRSWE